jgi:hypothetical protein
MAGTYRELFSEQEQRSGPEADLRLAPWEYRVYVGSGT